MTSKQIVKIQKFAFEIRSIADNGDEHIKGEPEPCFPKIKRLADQILTLLPFDPTCLAHGKKLSEHTCLYCCLCFRDLTPEECHVLPNGKKEDVCIPCAAREQAHLDK